MRKSLLSILLVFLSLLIIASFSFAGCKTTTPTTAAATTAAATTAAATTAAATTAAETTAKKYVIGRVNYALGDDAAQVADAKWGKELAPEYGVEVIIFDGKGTPEGQLAGVQDAIAKGVDCIVAQPVDSGLANTMVQVAREAGIPLITYYQPPDQEKAPHMAFTDKIQALEVGKLMAKTWKEMWPDKPIKAGVLGEPAVDFTVKNRTDPWKEGVLAQDPTAEIVAELDSQGKRETTFAAAQDLIQGHPEVNLVFTVNSMAGVGATAAFQSLGRGKMVDGKPVSEFIFGWDGNEEQIVLIADQTCSFKFSVAINPKSNAKAWLEAAIKVIKGEIPANVRTDIPVSGEIVDGTKMTLDQLQVYLDVYGSKVNLKEMYQK
jgi:ABC-type sugar transport system substrate-binding protein